MAASTDWIKMRMCLQSHPKVVRILSATCTDKFRVIGGLHAVWTVFDVHSIDGVLIGYTPAALDHVIGWDGFSEAMIAVGWLTSIDGNLVATDFSEHNGKSAKRRAEESKRKKTTRNSPQNVRNLSADCPQEDQTKSALEKEKEKEVKTTREPDGFAEFWAAYPKKVGRPVAEKAFAKAKINGHLPEVLQALEAQKQTDQWQKDNGQFIPNPATWINQKRWEDEIAPTAAKKHDPFAGAIN